MHKGRPRQICIVVGSPRQCEKHEILAACRTASVAVQRYRPSWINAISLAADEQDSKGVSAVCASFDESFSDFVKRRDVLIYQYCLSTLELAPDPARDS